VHTRSRAARQRPMQGGALHHRAFCVNFWIESLPGSYFARCMAGPRFGECRPDNGAALARPAQPPCQDPPLTHEAEIRVGEPS
jgi:hypothetical protein